VFVVHDVEGHGEREGDAAEQREEQPVDDGAGERESTDGHQERLAEEADRADGAEHVQQDQRVEVVDQVPHFQPPEEAPGEERQDRRDEGRVGDRAALVAVDGLHLDVGHAQPAGVELDEQVVQEAVVVVELVDLEGREGATGDGGVAVLGVHRLPVAAGRLRQAGEDGVAEPPPPAHATDVIPAEQAVALGVVRPPFDDGIDDPVEDGGVHLAVTVHDRDDVHSVLEGVPVPGLDGGADAAVVLVADGDDQGLVLGSETGGGGRSPVAVGRAGVVQDLLPGAVGRGVVDDVRPVDERREGPDDVADEPLLVVRRDHDGHGLSFVHGSWGRWGAERGAGSRDGRPVLLSAIRERGHCYPPPVGRESVTTTRVDGAVIRAWARRQCGSAACRDGRRSAGPAGAPPARPAR